MLIKNQEAWQEWQEANNGEGEDWFGYGQAVLRYAERWADLLEAKITERNDTSIPTLFESYAENLSYAADTEGITGFMYGMAVVVLNQVWEYGEYLARWHNKEYTGSEDISQGIVNPALLTISLPEKDEEENNNDLH